MVSNRLQYMDIAKGVGILLVIIGHHKTPQIINDWIYSFHMPFFFIIAGFFWHKISFKEELKKGIIHLLLPLWTTKIIWVMLLLIAYNYKGAYTGPYWKDWLYGALFEKGSFHLSITWFLSALFWGKLWMNILSHLSSTWRYTLIIVLFILPVSFREFWLQTNGTSFPCNFLQGMMVPLFLMTGHYLRYVSFFEDSQTTARQISIICLAFSFLLPLNMGAMLFPLSFWNILASISASIGLITICQYCSNIKRLKLPNNILAYIGKNSLAILCIHAIEFSVQPQRLFPSSINPYLHGIIVSILIVISVLSCRKLPIISKIYNIQ